MFKPLPLRRYLRPEKAARLATMLAMLSLMGWALLSPLAAAPLEVLMNTDNAQAGDAVTAGVRHSGLGASDELYFGVVLPGLAPTGESVFLMTEVGWRWASVSDLRTFAPLQRGPSAGAESTLVAYEFTGAEPPGTYTFFAFIAPSGWNADGAINGTDLARLDVRPLEALSPQISFRFEAGVPPADISIVRSGVALGARWFREQALGDPGPTTVLGFISLEALVRAYADWFKVPIQASRDVWATSTAVAGSGVVFVNLASAGWLSSGTSLYPTGRKIVVHEYFHVLQNTLVAPLDLIGPTAVPAGGPRWLIEGAAEYVGWRAVAEATGRPFADVLTTPRGRVAGSSTELPTMETLDGFRAAGGGLAYEMSLVALDFLHASYGLPATALKAFWAAVGTGVAWPDAFIAAFGRSIDQFYAEFATYRQSFPRMARISGQVTHAAGGPFPDINVFACPIVPGGCGFARSGPDGRYSIGVPDASYRVQFGRSDNGATPDGYYSSSGFTAIFSEATAVKVNGADVNGIDVELPF